MILYSVSSLYVVPSPMVTITNSTANIGDTTSLTCQVSGFPVGITPVYSWSPLTDTDSMLELTASLDNAGQHNCTVTGSYSDSNSDYVMLPAPVITPAYLTVNGKYCVYMYLYCACLCHFICDSV